MQDYLIVIPARYQSSRLPGKPLIDLMGKSMILRTYEKCIEVVPKENVIVATDDIRIYDHCLSHSMAALMTSTSCLTGTDRVAEVAQVVKAEYYINVQGDEPLFNSNDILKVLESIKSNKGKIINGYCSIKSREDFCSISIPKVVFRPDGRLLYMSRSPIPGNKNADFVKGNRQVCVYAFPKEALENFSKQKIKTTLENEEDIEILRFLEMGYEVFMIELSDDSIAVDNPSDVEKVLNRLRNENKTKSI
jgi:3-deoxy-manno-octulosonate cytidylyltransferase (CMP-KDO synthetase)